MSAHFWIQFFFTVNKDTRFSDLPPEAATGCLPSFIWNRQTLTSCGLAPAQHLL